MQWQENLAAIVPFLKTDTTKAVPVIVACFVRTGVSGHPMRVCIFKAVVKAACYTKLCRNTAKLCRSFGGREQTFVFLGNGRYIYIYI